MNADGKQSVMLERAIVTAPLVAASRSEGSAAPHLLSGPSKTAAPLPLYVIDHDDVGTSKPLSRARLVGWRYPVVGSDRYVVVATPRPETMLGDTAVAVHPEDERYADLIGKEVLLPLVNRKIPVIVLSPK